VTLRFAEGNVVVSYYNCSSVFLELLQLYTTESTCVELSSDHRQPLPMLLPETTTTTTRVYRVICIHVMSFAALQRSRDARQPTFAFDDDVSSSPTSGTSVNAAPWSLHTLHDNLHIKADNKRRISWLKQVAKLRSVTNIFNFLPIIS